MKMRTAVNLILMVLVFAGCMKGYPEDPNDGNNDKTCSESPKTTTITVHYSGQIPAKLNASVNAMPVVNECSLGTDNDNYFTLRSNNSVTVVLRVGNNAAMTDMFFNGDGTPKANVSFQFIMTGRENCGDTPGAVYSTTRTLNWEPTYASANKSCGPSGYNASISN